MTLQVAAGATVRLDLGGTGRAVVGKAALPAELAGRKDWLYGFCYLVRKPASKEPGGAGGDASSLGRRAASVIFKVEADGSFRIEDVEAGTYELIIRVNEEPADHRGLGNEGARDGAPRGDRARDTWRTERPSAGRRSDHRYGSEERKVKLFIAHFCRARRSRIPTGSLSLHRFPNRPRNVSWSQ